MTIKKIAPGHVAIIIGGNESWAEERNLPKLEAYRKAFEKIKVMPAWFFSRGVKVVSILVFSARDWQRPPEEVSALMKFLKAVLTDNLEEIKNSAWRVMITGKVDELPGDMPELCAEVQRETKDGNKGTLNLCLNYSGREEILQAIKKMISNNLQVEQIHEGIIRKYSYNNEIEDPDLLVAFGGVQSLADFQLWQAANSELIFLKKDWPDFEPSDVENLIEEYSKRKNVEE